MKYFETVAVLAVILAVSYGSVLPLPGIPGGRAAGFNESSTGGGGLLNHGATITNGLGSTLTGGLGVLTGGLAGAVNALGSTGQQLGGAIIQTGSMMNLSATALNTALMEGIANLNILSTQWGQVLFAALFRALMGNGQPPTAAPATAAPVGR